MSIHLSVPLVTLRLPLSSLSSFLSLSLSCFLSLLRIYRGEQRMWMGWVSPRLGERSITCEPKGEEIRGARRIYRNGAERKPEWWNTAKHARRVSHPAVPLAVPSRTLLFRRLSSFPLFRPPATLLPLPFSHCSSPPPHVPLLTCGTSRGLSIIIALRARAP